MRLRLSPHVTFHARGEAVFAWHGLTGEVAEFSRDVLALLVAFRVPSEPGSVARRRPGGLPRETADQYALVLAQRGFLVQEGVSDRNAALRRYAWVSPVAVWYRREDGALDVYDREGKALRLEAEDAAILDRCDGTQTLADLLDGRAPDALLALAGPQFAVLKLVPGRGVTAPPGLASTMPWPRIDADTFLREGNSATDPGNLEGYHVEIADPTKQFEETETTLSHLFRHPHPSIGGRTFGQALVAGLVAHGAARAPKTVLEVGGGIGWTGAAMRDAWGLARWTIVDYSPGLARSQVGHGLTPVRGDGRRLPVRDGVVDVLVSNEMCGDLGTEGDVNVGALALVREAARVLRPGGLAYVSEFGTEEGPPVRSTHLDHDEWSIRFGDLAREARKCGLSAQIVPVPKLVELAWDAPAVSTTRASFAALRGLFADRGVTFDKRAWTVEALTAACAGKVELGRVRGLVVRPIGERTMGLVPGEFLALVARKAA